MDSREFEVLSCEDTVLLVEDLEDADDFAAGRYDRRAEQSTRDKAGVGVNGTVKARVGVSVVDNDAFAGEEDVAGDARSVEQAQFAEADALRDAGIELVGFFVVEEERAALGPGLLHADFDDVARSSSSRVSAWAATPWWQFSRRRPVCDPRLRRFGASLTGCVMLLRLSLLQL